MPGGSSTSPSAATGASTYSATNAIAPTARVIFARVPLARKYRRARAWSMAAPPATDGADAMMTPAKASHMSAQTAEVVICGAGIAGIAAAYHLAVRRGITDVVIVDERPPLSLTSDKSAECYRNWWPGPGDSMVALMNRSIDLLEELARESGNVFLLNRRGYLFATADPARVGVFTSAAEEAAALGSGPVRIHDHPGSEYRP